MRISILTTVTNPEQRQDKWREAFENYFDFADQVVIVNGGEPFTAVSWSYPGTEFKIVDLPWPYEWNWAEYPRHLNAGLKECTGDWVLRLDIDQFIHENDFEELRKHLEKADKLGAKIATLQKMSFTYGNKYYQKGGAQIAFKNELGICFGKKMGQMTDLCFPIKQTGVELVKDETIDYELPVGGEDVNRLQDLPEYRTPISYWNYDHYFKTMEFMKKDFFRMSRAWQRYFKEWKFGSNEDESFEIFLEMMRMRYAKSPHTAKDSTHPKYIREAIKNIQVEQFGFDGWGSETND